MFSRALSRPHATGAATGAPNLPATPIPTADAELTVAETPRGHARRMARRTRLHGYVLAGVAVFAFVIALAASNTAQIKVSWLFGTSRVSLVWLVLSAAILGWLLGLLTNAALHRRTRAPRSRDTKV